MRKAHNLSKKQKKLNPGVLSGWHGRANIGTGRACSLPFFLVLACLMQARPCHLSGCRFFKKNNLAFSHHIRTITYKIKGNNRKQLNLWVASHEVLFYRQ